MSIKLANPSDQRKGPNCGVTAVAIASGASFTRTWNLFKSIAPRRYGKRWKGATYDGDYQRVLDKLGIDCTSYRPTVLRSPLHRWIAEHTKPDTVYIVVTTGHAQVVCNGTVIDQSGPKPVAEHWGRRKKVKFALHIYNPFAAAPAPATPSPLPAPAQPAATSLFPALFPTQAPAAAELQLSLF